MKQHSSLCKVFFFNLPYITANCSSPKYKFLLLLLSLFCVSVFAQKGGKAPGGSGGGGTKDIVIRACAESIGNGMYRVNFGYDNPNKKDVSVADDGSIVTWGKGKNKTNGPKNFKAGTVSKAFTMEFNEKDVVEWTVTNPSGKVFTVTASANSSKCQQGELGFIFPVFGQGNGKNNTIIGSELTSLAEGNAGDTPSEIIFQINPSDKVLVEIIPRSNRLSQVLTLLTTTFNLQYNSNPLLSDFIIEPSEITGAIDVFFPISRLFELNSYPVDINFVRPLYKPLQNSGIVTSQGDSVQYTSEVRESFRIVSNGEIVPVKGRGVKIGVISDGADTQPFTDKSKATVDAENGDLSGPGNPEGNLDAVQLLADYPYGSTSDEGRAMMHLIHDVAPEAKLAFSTGILSPRQFEQAINDLAGVNCDVIVDDITFTNEPMFGISNSGLAIQSFVSMKGKAYFSSAGNFANAGYQSTFISSNNVPQTNFLPQGSLARSHVFGLNSNGSQDDIQAIHVEPGVYMIVLQWAEGLASQEITQGATTDLDIYLVDDSRNLIVGNNRINLAGDAMEYIVFRATGSGQANIMITSANGPPPPGLALRYVAFRANGLDFIEYGGAPTVSGHAMTPQAITVGAVDYRNAANPEAQYFSSYGGQLANNSLVAVDFCAPDGGNTNVASIGQDISADKDNFPNFFGTSAAAPHAAAAFALTLSALPSWYPDGSGGTTFSVNDIQQLFKDTATPAGATERAGAGLINTANAFRSIAAQTAKLTSLIIENGKTPSAEPFEVTILGDYFPEDPKVIFDGQELTITSKSNGEIRALVGVFSNNPAIYVETSSITPGGTDGGLSNPLYFFEGNKIALNIIANDTSIEFGQSAAFDFTVEGLPEGVNFEDLGLPAIEYSSPAVFPYPDVNNYIIVPGFTEALTPEQADLFQVNFKNGRLEVTKKDLTIQPENTSYIYGQPIDVSLQYLYNPAGVTDNATFLEAISSSHESDFYEENSLILINKLRAVVNEQEILDLLDNGSWMTSEKIIQNKLRAVVNGMNLIDLDVQHLEDYMDAIIDPETNKLRAVVNKLRAVVNGQDLLNDLIDLVIENKLRAVVNETGLGDEEDNNDYSSVFAVIDAEDASTETEEHGIEKLFAMNMVTGLDVTPTQEDEEYIFPGAFLASIAANFNITYASGRLQILPASLQVSTGDLIIGQGEPVDISKIITSIQGYVYNETFVDVFPEGVQYIIEDANGAPYINGATGAFFIKIAAPQNYELTYSQVGVLYVNPTGQGVRKIRTYLDCVEVNTGAPDGLNYIAHYRYENPNTQTIYVLHGPDNLLSGPGTFAGETPVVFLPGTGTFEIRFDGNPIKWELTTLDSTHKSSTSSSASASSNKCPSGQPDAFVLYPNPVVNTLYISQSTREKVTLELFDIYGILYHTSTLDGSKTQTHAVEMSGYHKGIYFARITSKSEINVYSILKE